MIPEIELNPKYRVWDNDVPIVKNPNSIGTTYEVFLTGPIGAPDCYNELCFMLRTAKKGDEFNLHINTPGGVVDSGIMMVNAIKASKAHVNAILTGLVASAGTIVAMSCDSISVEDHLSFMIHNYSGGMQGKGHEMKARQNFTDANLTEAFNTFYKGFLSATEIKDVIEGKDLWFNSSEVQKRWDSKVDYLSTVENLYDGAL
jgi:ATP-dependent protease ClpP protease subunit